MGWVRRRLRRGERGVVAVEAALVTPLLCILIFGMIEFAFVMKDYAGVSSMVRIGARMAATGADAGQGVCDTSPGAPPCTPAGSPALAQLAADAIQRSGSVSDPNQIDYLLIYKANSSGYPGALTSMPSNCAGVSDCVMFKWRSGLSQFRYDSGAWDSKTISACFPGSPTNPLDRVGVYVHATHKMMTSLFVSSMALQDRAVMDFEPLATQTCGTNQHQ